MNGEVPSNELLMQERIKKPKKKSESKKGMKYNEEKRIRIDGKSWLTYSISVWNDIVKSNEERKIHHPAMFPVELPKRLIQVYTRKGDVVLDPFMGSGSVLVAAKMIERNGVGFEINKDFIKLAKKRLKRGKVDILTNFNLDVFLSEPIKEVTEVEETEQIIHEVDARKMLDYVKPESIQLCITSPPYWDILRQERTADYKEIRPYSDSEVDLGNIAEYHEFIGELKKVFKNVHQVLTHGSRCIIVVMDIRKKNKFYPFHMDITNMMKEIGFELEDIIIWDRRSDYSNLRPLGYPYVFRVNKIHEFILMYIKNGVPEIEENDR